MQGYEILFLVGESQQGARQSQGELWLGSQSYQQSVLARVDKIDSLLAEYQQKNPNQITTHVISDFLADNPIARDDKGKDFVEFVMERLESDYSRNRIGKSRYENGKSGMNIFQTFLRATKKGTYKQDSIYLGEISVELIDEYIKWRREIKQNNTKPELLVRKFLFSRGFRYRLNHSRLPGHPDLVLRMYRTVIFVNGCFWHGHEGCKYYVPPKTNVEFWQNKIERNKFRDKEEQRKLASMGWHCITVWECQLQPKVREQTLEALVYTLCHIFLNDRRIKPYEDIEEKYQLIEVN